MGVHLSLGHGELLELPITRREGFADALLFEAAPGGDLEALADASFQDGPAAFDRLVLEKLERHFPMAYERVDRSSFGLMGPADLLQGALTPVVREDYARLSSGTYALAMGDAHCVVDQVAVRRLYAELQSPGSPMGGGGDARAHGGVHRAPHAARGGGRLSQSPASLAALGGGRLSRSPASRAAGLAS